MYRGEKAHQITFSILLPFPPLPSPPLPSPHPLEKGESKYRKPVYGLAQTTKRDLPSANDVLVLMLKEN